MTNNKQQSTDKPTDKRKTSRFPCVGIALLYSSPHKQPMSGVGTALLRAATHDISLAGMSFDVSQDMQVGQQLLVAVRDPDEQQAETLKTEVRWCKKLDGDQYRVGVAILDIETIADGKNKAYKIKHIGHGIEAPAGARFVCPACGLCSWFDLIGEQPDIPSSAIMPLYNCNSCHTTRTITSLLTFNRQSMKTE